MSPQLLTAKTVATRKISPISARVFSLAGVKLPPGLRTSAFDNRKAVSIPWIDGSHATLVPPRNVFADMARDLNAAMANARPWLIISTGQLGKPEGQLLTLKPGRCTGVLRAELRRESGRLIAKGFVERNGQKKIGFALEFLCMTARRDRPRPVLKGTLDSSGKWGLEVSVEESR